MSLQFTSLEYLILGSNRLEGPIPSLPNTLVALDLSENSIAGPLPLIWNTPQLSNLLLSSNQINGSIPSYICKLEVLEVLDLSNNSLSGELPQCWNNSSLLVLDLSNNNLTSEIPSSIGSLSSLTLLHLNNNNFYGELPLELQHCNNLVLLDLSNNELAGEIPTWIDENLQDLVVLQLRSNMFVGEIPSELARLAYLQFLDLAHNNLTGSIPRSFGNFSAMIYHTIHNYDGKGFSVDEMMTYTAFDYNNNLLVVIHGEEYQYSTTIYLLKIMDLSENNLSGQIPEEIVALALLRKNCTENETMPNVVGDNHPDGSESTWPYLGMGLGFVAGFWSACGILIFKKSWSSAYFQMIDRLYDKIYVTIAIRMRRLNRNMQG
ncbi:LRR receptor-like serine/threonine-protein kinase GSO1 [Ananas comosus]|uniref:LRR receptor-like serine/threonine-protein kinase GSO1 n=1 Tax=Ananas comosus TaxID=4615 RepID=A0A199UW20_ANACO|nr:LRR receptor-like serine/threonine-protein kinase GSO1 [Ananas comosus]